MTSPENSAAGIRPRPVVDMLPRYAAGKPPAVVEGLTSYKLSSNENPLPPIPAVLQAIADQTDFNRYPDPLSTKLRGALAEFLDIPAEDIVTGAGSLGALNQILVTFAGQNDDGKADEVIYAWRSFEAYPICVGLTGAESVRIPVTADGRHDLDAMAAAVTARTKVSLLCTDQWIGYKGLDKNYPHATVDHARRQYVVGAVHTQTIEGFWSIFKRGVVGSFHKVSRKYLPLYVAEFQFRYNNRFNDDIFRTAIKGC